jgi:hypothetical protein
MAFFYKPTEMPWRIALFYSVGQLSSALSGLLAFAISFVSMGMELVSYRRLMYIQMDGLCGLSGWRWLFLLEGLPAIILSFVALFGLPDYPETARMLTDEERAVIVRRLASIKVSGQAKSWSWPQLATLFKDPTLYTFATYWIAHGIGGFGINYALPTVVYELGFTTTAKSQLMNIASNIFNDAAGSQY